MSIMLSALMVGWSLHAAASDAVGSCKAGDESCSFEDISMLQTNGHATPAQRHSTSDTPATTTLIPGVYETPPVYCEYLKGKNIELVDTASPEAVARLNSLNTKDKWSPGATLFGDKGYLQNGWGGINSFGVVRVVNEPIYLYGMRPNRTTAGDAFAYNNVWFGDATGFKGQSFLEASNQRVLTCWNFEVFERCKFNVGTVMVVGSGGWRSTTRLENGCNSSVEGISPIQVAPPEFLQYIVAPSDAAEECCVAPLNKDDVMASFDGDKCVKVDPLGPDVLGSQQEGGYSCTNTHVCR